MSEHRSEGASPDIAAILKPDSFERAIRYSLEHAVPPPLGSDGPIRPISASAGGGIVSKFGDAVKRGLRVAKHLLRKRRR